MTTDLTADAASPSRTLSDLEDHERYRRFEALQDRMPSVWRSMRLDLEDESVVVSTALTSSSAESRTCWASSRSCSSPRSCFWSKARFENSQEWKTVNPAFLGTTL